MSCAPHDRFPDVDSSNDKSRDNSPADIASVSIVYKMAASDEHTSLAPSAILMKDPLPDVYAAQLQINVAGPNKQSK